MVSKASEDLPEPETPVTTVTRSWGMARDTFFRLFCRAPSTRSHRGCAIRYVLLRWKVYPRREARGNRAIARARRPPPSSLDRGGHRRYLLFANENYSHERRERSPGARPPPHRSPQGHPRGAAGDGVPSTAEWVHRMVRRRLSRV